MYRNRNWTIWDMLLFKIKIFRKWSRVTPDSFSNVYLTSVFFFKNCILFYLLQAGLGVGVGGRWRKRLLLRGRTRAREPRHRGKGARPPRLCHRGRCAILRVCLQRVAERQVTKSLKITTSVPVLSIISASRSWRIARVLNHVKLNVSTLRPNTHFFFEGVVLFSAADLFLLRVCYSSCLIL